MRSVVSLILVIVALALVSCGDDAGSTPTLSPSRSASQSGSHALTASPSPASSNGTWTSLAPLPTPRSEVAVAAVNGLIYVVGGFEANGAASTKVEVYDPATDSWSEAPSLPRPRHHTAAAEWKGDLLVIGGYQTGFGDPQTTVFRFDPDNQEWSENPPLNVARGGHAAAVISGNAVVLGGAGADGKSLTSAEWLDYRYEEWHRFDSDMSVPRDHLAVAAVSIPSGDIFLDRVYAIGGRRDIDFGQNLDANEYARDFYDWEAAAPMPTARSGIAAATVDGRIYVFGGEGPGGTFNNNEVYDPTTDTWSAAAPMPIAVHGHGAAVVDGVIYVFGGGPTPGLSVSNANEAFRP